MIRKLQIHQKLHGIQFKSKSHLFIKPSFYSSTGSTLTVQKESFNSICYKPKYQSTLCSSLLLNKLVNYSISPESKIRMLSSSPRTPKKSIFGNLSLSSLASIGVGATFLLGKANFLLVGLKLTKLTPLLSMIISSFAYSLFYGWPYAIGMVGLIFCHECGHLVVMQYYKIPFSPMVFIPFMGASIMMEGKPRNSYEEAIIAFGGPIAGSLAALSVGTIGNMTDNQLLIALADFGYIINLFNLLPIGYMDGGRIGNAISPYFGLAGLAGGGYLIYTSAIVNPIFYLVMLSGTYSTASRLLGWDREEPNDENNSNHQKQEDYYHITYGRQLSLLTGYMGLIGCLLYAIKENNRKRLTPKQLQAQAKGHHNDFEISFNDGVYDDYFAHWTDEKDKPKY